MYVVEFRADKECCYRECKGSVFAWWLYSNVISTCADEGIYLDYAMIVDNETGEITHYFSPNSDENW